MKKYSIFHAPFMSFYSGDFYRDVGLNWSGTGFGFLFLLLFLCVIPKGVQVQFSLLNFAEQIAPGLIRQVPEINIVKGEASSPAEQPYTIRAPGSGKPLAIVDTTGATVSLEGSEALLLVRKTELLVKRDPLETRTISLGEIENFTLNQSVLNSLLSLACRYGGMLSALLALLGALVFRIAQALLYGALGLGMASLLGVAVPYRALLRLSVMAVTPAIVVTTAADAAGHGLPHPWLLAFGAAMGLLYFGIKSVSGPEKPVSPAPGEKAAQA